MLIKLKNFFLLLGNLASLLFPFLVILGTFNYYNNFETSRIVLIISFLLQLIYIGYLVINFNFLPAAFGFALSMGLITGVLMEVYQEVITFNGWITEEVFQKELTILANNIILIGTSLFYFICHYTRKKQIKLVNTNQDSQQISIYTYQSIKFLSWTTLILGATFNQLTAPQKNILEAQYATDATSAVNSSGLQIIGLAFLGASVMLMAYTKGFSNKSTRIIILFSCISVIISNLMRGDRDGALAFFIFVGAAFFIYSKITIIQKLIRIGVLFLFFYSFLKLWGEVRINASEKGLASAFFTSSVISGQNVKKGFNPSDDLDLMPMMYWHLLDCIDLYQKGISLNGSSYFNLIPQAIPEFISNWLGYQRPRNVAWVLMDYKQHGGGFYIIAEAFWNGGLISVYFFMTCLALMLNYIEKWFYRQKVYLLVFYFGYIGTFMTCVFYSMQILYRQTEIWIGLAFIFKFIVLISNNYFIKVNRINKNNLTTYA